MPNVISTEEFNRIIDECSPLQLTWLSARVTSNTDKEAAEAIGVAPETAYKWKRTHGLESAVRYLRMDAIRAAQFTLHQHTTAAARKMVELLESGNDSVALGAAKEILSRSGITGDSMETKFSQQQITIRVERDDPNE